MRLITEATSLPPGWKLSTVSEACAIRDELRFPLSVEQRKEMQGAYPYYGPTGVLDFLDEFRVEGTFALIGEDGDHFLKYAEWPMTQLVTGKFNVNNHAHLISGTDVCTTEWFFNYFHHVDLKPLLSLQGVGRYKLTRGALEKLPIAVPPVPEQKAIAAVLSAWDRAIEQTTALIAAKERLKQGLIQQLLTGNRRFRRFTDHWKETALSSFLRESRVLGSNGDAARKLTVKLYGKGVVAKQTVRAGSAATQYYRRSAGQLVYSKLDFLNGAFGIIPENSTAMNPRSTYQRSTLIRQLTRDGCCCTLRVETFTHRIWGSRTEAGKPGASTPTTS